MTLNLKYKLDTSPQKHKCPGCDQKRFVRYIDSATGNYLPEKFGRCDRESNCGYHLNPYKSRHELIDQKENEQVIINREPQPVYYMPEKILNATLKEYEKNVFIKNLKTLVDESEIEKIIDLYKIGTIGRGCRYGAVTFPFIDKSGNIRTIQVKQFDETNHTLSTDYIHSIIMRYYNSTKSKFPDWLANYVKNEKYVTCLFGEHLLTRYPTNPIALVEAPKTAIIGSLYYGSCENPDNFLWLAVYNKSSLTVEKCKSLQGRNVVLFPDLNAFDDWSKKAKDLNRFIPGTRFSVSDSLQNMANESDIKQGLDLADYLPKLNWNLLQLLKNTNSLNYR
jgi:hypothetical protein